MTAGKSPTGIVAITESAQAFLTNGEIDVNGDIAIIIIVHTIKNDSKNHDDLLVRFR